MKWDLTRGVSTRDLIKGRIDFHIHPGPDPYPRVATAMEIAYLARNAGMKAVVLKCFETMTPQLAATVEEAIPGIHVIGGVCMEGAIGGINPRAVEMAIRAGAKVVWMPALDSSHNLEVAEAYQKSGRKESTLHHMKGILGRSDPRAKLRVTRDGVILPEVEEILDMVATANIVAATGHMNKKDRAVFVDAAVAAGVKKIVLTHANASWAYADIEEQKQLTQKPGVYIEYVIGPLLGSIDAQDPKILIDMITAVTPQRAVLGTDCGTSWSSKGVGRIHPTEGLATLVGILLNNGISPQDIDTMSIKVPSMLLDLD
jgi:hypothetical protein